MTEQVQAVVEADPSETSLSDYRANRGKTVETPKPAEVKQDGSEVPPASDQKPAETAAPEKPAEGEPDPSSEAGKELAKKKGSLQSRIDELRREQGATQRERDLIAAELAQTRAELARLKGEKPAEAAKPPAPAVSDPNDPEPDEETYFAQNPEHTYGQFTKAVGAWNRRQALREAQAVEQQRAHQAALQQRFNSWAERRDTFVKANPAFVEETAAFFKWVPPDSAFEDVIVDSPVGPQLARYLATHPDEVNAIARQPTAAQYRALGRIEAQIEAEAKASGKPAETKAEEKPVSKAPEPVTPVNTAGRSTGTGTPSPREIEDLATYRANRKKFDE